MLPDITHFQLNNSQLQRYIPRMHLKNAKSEFPSLARTYIFHLPQFNPELSLLIFTQIMKVFYHHLNFDHLIKVYMFQECIITGVCIYLLIFVPITVHYMILSIDTHFLVYNVNMRFHPICRLIIAHNVVIHYFYLFKLTSCR